MPPFEDYPDNWDGVRKRVYRRDNWECQGCGATGVELHAHHKIPRSVGGSDEPDNLITLCKGCHARLHPFTGLWWSNLNDEFPIIGSIFNIVKLLIYLYILWMIISSLL